MQRNPERFDVAVVGLGLIGAAALRALSQRGLRTIGLGPGEPATFASHTGVFASHYDSGRVTRMIDPMWQWGLLAKRSIAEYRPLGEATGITFHGESGHVYSATDAADLSNLEHTVARVGIDGTFGTAGGAFPDPRLNLAGRTVFAERGPAGHIDPRRMITAQLRASEAAGATLQRSTVESIDRVDGGWRLRADDGSTVFTEKVLVAAGPHADELLTPWGRVELDVRNEAVITATLDAAEQARLDGLPSVLADVDDEMTDALYMVPPTLYPDGTVRIKLGAELFNWRTLATGDARRAWMRSNEHATHLPHLQRILCGLVPGLRATAWETKPCLIAHTPTVLPYVDHLDDGLVIVAGCNGYAAKSADAIGALSAGLLAEGRWTDPDLAAADFTIRFAT